MESRSFFRGGLCLAALIAVAVVVVPVLGAQASGKHQVYLPNKCINAKVKPKQVVLGCADFGFYMKRVQWEHWKNPHAIGRGDALVNDCDPSCEQGTFHKFSGKLRVHGIKRCPQDGLRHYTKSKFTFVGDRPSGYPKRFRQGFPCSLIQD